MTTTTETEPTKKRKTRRKQRKRHLAPSLLRRMGSGSPPGFDPSCLGGPVSKKTQKSRRQFERTLAPHLDELYGSAMRLTRSPADADDVLQEAMARAWAFWERYEEGTNVRAWMHRILFNTFVNGYRRRKREREVLTQVHRERVPDPFWTRPEPSLAGEPLGDEVKGALASLPETFRQAIELVDLGGASYRDAAEVVGCPVGTIMSRLHRGRRLLGAQLREYAIEEGYLAAA